MSLSSWRPAQRSPPHTVSSRSFAAAVKVLDPASAHTAIGAARPAGTAGPRRSAPRVLRRIAAVVECSECESAPRGGRGTETGTESRWTTTEPTRQWYAEPLGSNFETMRVHQIGNRGRPSCRSPRVERNATPTPHSPSPGARARQVGWRQLFDTTASGSRTGSALSPPRRSGLVPRTQPLPLCAVPSTAIMSLSGLPGVTDPPVHGFAVPRRGRTLVPPRVFRSAPTVGCRLVLRQ